MAWRRRTREGAALSAIEQHYSVERVCELFEISESKVRRAMGKKPGTPGYLRSVQVGLVEKRGSRRIPESALVEWLRSDAPSESLAPVVELRERRTK